MKNIKKFAAAGITVIMLTAGALTAYAAVYSSPADAVAGLTGREVQSVIDERRQSGKTYGTIADEAGVLDEFKAAVYELKGEHLQSMVDSGRITREDADEILAIIKEQQAVCDGSGNSAGGTGLGGGCGFGRGNGGAQGMGYGRNYGSCMYR